MEILTLLTLRFWGPPPRFAQALGNGGGRFDVSPFPPAACRVRNPGFFSFVSRLRLTEGVAVLF